MLSPLKYLLGAVILYFILYYGLMAACRQSLFRWISRIALVLYCFFIVWITLTGRESAGEREYELRFLWTYKHAIMDNAWDLFYEGILNIALFIPFGMLLHASARRWGWLYSLVFVVLAAAVCSGSVEVMQFSYKLGLCELDDVMHNTLGALIGWGIFLSFKGVIRIGRRTVLNRKKIAVGLMPLGMTAVLLYLFSRVMHYFNG